MADKSGGTFINAVIINSDEVSLIKSEVEAWEIHMDRSMVKE